MTRKCKRSRCGLAALKQCFALEMPQEVVPHFSPTVGNKMQLVSGGIMVLAPRLNCWKKLKCVSVLSMRFANGA